MRRPSGMKTGTSSIWLRRGLALLVLAGSGFLLLGQTVPQPQNLFAAPTNMEQLAAEVTAASYMVACGTGSGSGWGLKTSWQGKDVEYIVTNYHVIEDCLTTQSPTVFSSKGVESSAEVVIFQKRESNYDRSEHATDLALLKPTDIGIDGLSMLTLDFPLGSWVMTSSYPGVGSYGNPHTITTGVISSLVDLEGISTTAAVNPGSSGGVVVNSRGEVVGTIYRGWDEDVLNDVGLFLSTNRLRELLAKAHDELPATKTSSGK
jgi:S1-C subfamily serine protease